MQLRVSQDEFTKIVKALQRRYLLGQAYGIVETSKAERIEEIFDFLRDFLIDTGIECLVGLYNCELVVGRETILLDTDDGCKRLKGLLMAAMVPWESIKI